MMLKPAGSLVALQHDHTKVSVPPAVPPFYIASPWWQMQEQLKLHGVATQPFVTYFRKGTSPASLSPASS